MNINENDGIKKRSAYVITNNIRPINVYAENGTHGSSKRCHELK